jgi:hypothetical protein
MNYQEIKNQQPILRNCFFAFSKEQFNEGIAKHNLEGQKIYQAQGGLYGTNEGISELMNFYSELDERIANECDPQEVYDYEIANHECSYTNDDTDVMLAVMNTFGWRECTKIKRKYVTKDIGELISIMEENASGILIG